MMKVLLFLKKQHIYLNIPIQQKQHFIGEKYTPQKKKSKVRAEKIENKFLVSFYVGCERA